ncbi:hypothetical protein [Marinimicrobium sp. ABcell2]|uniref:hypothetical protein n=1 Tax=Marinimicrobium sp. ABcell2 TaxID=3069751 RepID=UPI0027B6675A|nr:hypothetical protein [Marinimicrobium sp. ABcell2]MDQ2076202.1 hypothetical protein [Marinimicrobium sp. ABcell2]
MKYLILCLLITLSGCTHGQRNDHYYCNDRASLEDYTACMEAGEEIRDSQESAL